MVKAEGPQLGWPELIVLIFGFVVRAVVVTQATWYPVSDTNDYHLIVARLMEYGEYLLLRPPGNGVYDDFPLYAYRMPGYPFFLLGIYSVWGWQPIAAYWGNVGCDLITIIMVGMVGQKLLGRRVALLAQMLVALHILWTPNLMTESIFTMLFWVLVAALVYQIPAHSLRGAFGFGGLLVMAVMVRPIALVLVPLALSQTIIWPQWRRSVGLSLMLLLPFAGGLGVWGARNYHQLGEVVWLSTNSGLHNAESFGVNKRKSVAALRQQGLNEAQINQALNAAIIANIKADPLMALAVYGRRMAGLFSLVPVWEMRELLWSRTFAIPAGKGQRFAGRLHQGLYWHYFLVYLLALGGALLSARKGFVPRIVWAIGGSFVVCHALVSDGNVRFAAPLYPLFCLLAALALVQLQSLEVLARAGSTWSKIAQGST